MQSLDLKLDKYLKSGRCEVGGWASRLLLERVRRIDGFQDQLGITGNVGEIGVHHGKLFIFLYLLRGAGERGVAIDLFEDQALNVDKSGMGDRAIFLDNIRRHAGDVSDLAVIASDSTRLSGDDVCGCVGGKLRLLSIDGGHLSNIVAHDLNTAAECLTEGGVVLVDDYLNPEFPGVAEGTLRFLMGDRRLKPFCVSTQKLYLTTAGYEEHYLRLLYEAETGRNFDSRGKYNFVRGRDSAVRTADLCDTEVLCFSDDQFSDMQKIRRRIRRVALDGREYLSRTALWRGLKAGPAGSVIRKIANGVVPYR